MKGMGAVVVCVLAVATAGLNAGTISEASFFSSIPHTTITFENYGHYYHNGELVNVPPGGELTMYYDEYLDLGVWFEYKPSGYLDDLSYVNENGTNFEVAQSIGGSLQNAILSPTQDVLAMIFEVPVKSFGFWAVNNNTVPTIATFTAKNASGTVLGTVSMTGSLVDGTVGGVADYGFMGIWANENIKRVEIVKDAAILDNLTFSPQVPEPVSLALLALGAVAVRRRRAGR